MVVVVAAVVVVVVVVAAALLRLFVSLKMLYFDVESCRVTEANQLAASGDL